jgi:molybdopterin-guanine dinucleotide biosynthesis protein B
VIISAPDKIASIRKLEQELTLDEIISSITDMDIIITEGYKSAGKPALEVLRAEISTHLLCEPEQLVAVASDISVDINVPQFKLDDYKGIVDFIVAYFHLSPNKKHTAKANK